MRIFQIVLTPLWQILTLVQVSYFMINDLGPPGIEQVNQMSGFFFP